MAQDNTEFTLIIVIFVLVIITMIASAYAASYYKSGLDCKNDPNIRCFKDFDCPYSQKCSDTIKTFCWPGVEAVYSVSKRCEVKPGQGVPETCTCQWSGTLGQPSCRNV